MSSPSVLEQIVATQGTAWCDRCKRRAGVVDKHVESGPPRPTGVCDVYDVTDLDCGHQTEQLIPGATDQVI